MLRSISTVSSLMICLPGIVLAAPVENQGLADRVSTLEMQVKALTAALEEAQEVLQYIRVQAGPINELAGPHVIIEGANVHVRSGSGSTGDGCDVANPNCASLTGLGNLVLGYNEPEPESGPVPGHRPVGRTGSHNLVVGPEHGFTSFGGLVAGQSNAVTGASSSVSGGLSNRSTGETSSISGGIGNDARGDRSSVSGGFKNRAIGDWSSVSGGVSNDAIGLYSSVSGGGGNEASGSQSSVTGGSFNEAIGVRSSVSGGGGFPSDGGGNVASGENSSVSGGDRNEASGRASSVSGGVDNEASGAWSSVSGGEGREAPGDDNWAAGSLLEPN